jgi:purine-binding chemotaxis protein CheW
MTDYHDINWDEIRQRFAWDEIGETGETIQKRLQQRAKLYAAPNQRAEFAPEEVRTALTFELGVEHYGVDVMTVRGVRTISRITRVPGTPAFYRGVVNVRGQVITVMDMRLFFNIPVGEESRVPDELVVVQAAGLEIGLLAHNVEGVRTIPISALEPVDNMRYALGVTTDRLVMLDVQRLLQDEQLVVGGQDDVS